MDDSIVDWATKVLQSSNNIPPRELIQRLLADEADLVVDLLAMEPDFAAKATKARNGVAHPGAAADLTTARRYWYGEILLVLVRARLLIEAGIPRPDVHAAVAKRGTFAHAVQELRATAAT